MLSNSHALFSFVALSVMMTPCLGQLQLTCNIGGTKGNCTSFIPAFCNSIGNSSIAPLDTTSRCFNTPGFTGKCDLTAWNRRPGPNGNVPDVTNCVAALSTVSEACPTRESQTSQLPLTSIGFLTSDMMLSRMGLVEKSRGHFSLAETQSLGIAYHQGARACAVLGLFTVPVTGTAVVLTGVRRANPSVPSGGGEIFLRDGTGDGTVTDNGTVSALSHENLWPFIRVTCGLGIAEKSGTTFRVRQTAFVRFGFTCLPPKNPSPVDGRCFDGRQPGTPSRCRPVEKFPNSPTERVGCPSHGTRRTVATGTANSPTPFSSNMIVLPEVRAPLGALPLLCSTGCIQACGLLYTGDLELEASNECDVQWLTCTSQLACLCLLRCYGPRIRIQHVVVYPAKDHPTPET
ncbi:hypothetical protein B0H10DRAFT_1961135 [Mycena sp. CBHHK59/15]|nr:hypothetical protein B0H10DRAFT_1961135 [Mycena sp. CBHHK59/15]